MCGIVGFLVGGKHVRPDGKRASFMEQALYVDAVRGRDSTGLFTMEKKGDIEFAKDAVDANRFLEQRNFNDYVGDVGKHARFAVGHNRAGTIGANNYDSAHPYNTENVVMVHNGTLKHWNHLPEHDKGRTDSARIAQALSNVEPEKAAGIIEDLNGAYTLVWYDKRNGSCNMVRNDDRPLSFIHLDNDQLFFASEGAMLSWLLYRNNISAAICEAKALPINTLTSWINTKKGLDLDNPIITELKPHPYYPPITSYNHNATTNTAYDGWNYVGPEGQQEIVYEDRRPAPRPASKSAQKRDQFLNDLGVTVIMGDQIEVDAGLFTQYSSKGEFGKNEGWFSEENHNLITEEKFHGQVFCDVHSVPTEVAKGHNDMEVDSFLATVRGIKPDSFTAADVTLLSTYTRVKMYRKKTDDFDEMPNLKDFFGAQRWYYDFGDAPSINHPHYDIELTKRETDMWTENKECTGCNVPGIYTPTNQIIFQADLKQGFLCHDCFKKAG